MTEETIAIYSHFPSDSTPQIVREIKDREVVARRAAGRRNTLDRRDDYPALIWAMHELPGSTWRNAHTFGVHVVERIDVDRHGRHCPDLGMGGYGELGFWWNDRFVIENWCRVDHLPPEDQVSWAEARVTYCRQQLVEAKEKLHRIKASLERERLKQAQTELENLAEELGVLLDSDVRNVGAQPGEQLVLL